MALNRTEIKETVQRLVDEAASWPHIETGEHCFGGTEFWIDSREIGHVHARETLDVAYVKPLRNALVAVDLTGGVGGEYGPTRI